MTDSPKHMTIDEIIARINDEASRLGAGAIDGVAAPPPPSAAPVATAPAPVNLRELLGFQDIDFIWEAYRRVLGREADSAGLEEHLQLLRAGALSKLDVLVGLRWSGEGVRRNVQIDGLERRRRVLRLYSLPIVGRAIEWFSIVARLPRLIRDHRRMDAQIDRFGISVARVPALQSQVSEIKFAHESFRMRQDRLAEDAAATAQRADGLAAETGELRDDLGELVRTTGGFGGAVEAVRRTLREQRQMLLEQQRQIASLLATIDGRAPPPRTAPAAPEESAYDALYLSFENAFRGDYEDVKQRQQIYLPAVSAAVVAAGTDAILDVGCGRGEWIELLKEAGYRPRGIDVSAAMVAACVERGLDAREGDAVAMLAEIPDGTLAVVSGFHVVEHVPTAAMLKLLDEIHRVLRPGGIAILETPNARNILVGSGDFYRDPTHRNPVFPDTLAWFGEARGFEPSRILWVDGEKRRLIPAEDWKFDELDDYVRVPRDYAWIGTKPPPV